MTNDVDIKQGRRVPMHELLKLIIKDRIFSNVMSVPESLERFDLGMNWHFIMQ